MRVPGHLPGVSVRIGEIPRVAAPFGRHRLLEQVAAGLHGLGEKGVHLFTAGRVVSEGDTAKTARVGQVRVSGQQVPRVQGQGRAGVQPEQGKIAHTGAGQGPAQTVPVKPEGPGQIGNAKGDDMQAWFHPLLLQSDRMHDTVRHGTAGLRALVVPAAGWFVNRFGGAGVGRRRGRRGAGRLPVPAGRCAQRLVVVCLRRRRSIKAKVAAWMRSFFEAL